MQSQRLETILYIAETYQTILRALHRRNAPGWLELDLSVAQLKTLIALSDEGPASHLVDRLVQAALAERIEDAADRRRTLACLTPKGEEQLACLLQGSRDRLRTWLTYLNDDDLAALLQGLQALHSVARSGEN